MLQTLQWGAPTERWVLKAPSHLSSLSLVFATYPDARVVITHRDPLRVVGSLADMMATLHWMHSDHVDHEILVQFLCMGLELQMDGVTAERDAGGLPADQIADVRYADLVADPVAVVTGLYAGWDLEMQRRPSATRSSLRRGPPHPPGRRRPRLPLRGHRPRPGRAPRPGRPLPGAASTSPPRSLSHGSCRSPDGARARRSGGADRRPAPSARSCSPRGAPRCRASWPRPDRSAR